MPSLQSIQLENNALQGDDREERKTISDKPFNYKNTLTMRSEREQNDECSDLPSLTEFSGRNNIFQIIGVVTLESIDLEAD